MSLLVECTELHQNCHCSIQASTACNKISDASCNITTDSCVCNPASFAEVDGVCQYANRVIADGSSIAPFKLSTISTTSFTPVQGVDNSKFGVEANGWYLSANGKVSMQSNSPNLISINKDRQKLKLIF